MAKNVDLLPSLIGDSSGNCYQNPYDFFATNDVWKYLVWIFADTSTKIGAFGSFTVPDDYVGTAKVVIEWTATVGTGNVVWGFEYRGVGGNDAESLDQTSNQESATVTDTAPGAAHRKLTAEISLTSSNLAAGDIVQFLLFRDGTSGSDTMASDAILHGVKFQYSPS